MPPTTRPNVVAPVDADELMVIEAVTLVADAVVILPLTPALAELTAEAALKFVPVNVTVNVVPAVPLFGLKEVSVGAAAMTVNGCDTVVPPTTRPKVVTPAAAAELIVIEAVTLVADLDVMVPLTPALAELTAVTALKFVPVNVTVNGALPAVPLAGLTEVSVGVAAAVVNVAAKALASVLPARSLTPPAWTVTVYGVPASSGAAGVMVTVEPNAVTAAGTAVPLVVSNTSNVVAVLVLIGLLNVIETDELTATPVAPLAGLVESTVGAT